MSDAAHPKLLATAADLLAIPEDERFHEIIGGEVVRRAVPSGPRGLAQLGVGGLIRDAYGRQPGGSKPGGWWIVTGVEVELEKDQVYRPDVCGWRRDRLPALPRESPIMVRPDWVCEVISRSNAGNDRVKKLRVYHGCEVPHDWLVDPDEATLTVFRWTPDGYLVVLSAERGDKVCAEPFGAAEIDVGALFGDDTSRRALSASSGP
jgi:Uma2 family endonuclease